MTHKMLSFTGSGCHLTGVYTDNNKTRKPYALYSHYWNMGDHRTLIARFDTAAELLQAAANIAAHGHI